MPQTTSATVLPLLAMLALIMPGEAVAGPPEGVSGKMVLAPDPVGDGLRQYRQARDQATRLTWLRKLAPTQDPRVALALWEEGPHERKIVTVWECRMIGLLNQHFVRGARVDGKEQSVWEWWDANEADLRRRAKQHPR
jgi:hypothetical protein